MLQNCGYCKNRHIFYCDLENDLNKTEEFPTKNWLLFAIADKAQLDLLYSFAERCLDRNVLYICGAGEACSEIDDAFDMVVVDRRSTDLNKDLTQDDFKDTPMTTWHYDLDEGFWFAVTTACHEKESIKQVVVANLTEKSYERYIKDLVERIDAGWLPPD